MRVGVPAVRPRVQRPRTQVCLLCGRALLVPHTTMCMGVESFTEENRSPLHLWTYISFKRT